jgi:hypothetical protein
VLANGSFIVSDSGGGEMRAVNMQGTTQQMYTVSVPSLYIEKIAMIGFPLGSGMDGSRNLYTASYSQSAVYETTTAGVTSVFAGTAGSPGFSGDGGDRRSAQLNTPFDVKVGPDGKIHIIDTGNNLERVVDPTTGVITTATGDYNVCGTVGGYLGDNGPSILACLNYPIGVGGFDSHRNYYIGDLNNNAFRKVTLYPATATLTTACAGSGNGSVASNDSVIACTCTVGVASGTCTDTVTGGAQVILTATASGIAFFTGFSGGGCSTSPCTVTAGNDTTVTAYI